MTHSELFQFETFGALLHYLRRRARLTQKDLAIAVGYSEAHISRLERDQRTPDLTALAALFIPQLDLETQPDYAARLMELAAAARGESLNGRSLTLSHTTTNEYQQEIGSIEAIPSVPEIAIERRLASELSQQVSAPGVIQLNGQAGTGKTVLAAQVAHRLSQTRPVFWFSINDSTSANVAVLLRQLALFGLSLGAENMATLLNQSVEDSPPSDQQMLYISQALQPYNALIWIDNAELLSDEHCQIFKLLIEQRTTTLVLISQKTLNLPSSYNLTVGALESKEAHQFIEQLEPKLAQSTRHALIEQTNGHPMLLRLAVGALRSGLNPSLLERLATRPNITRYLVETTLANMPESARLLLELIAVANTPLDLYNSQLIQHIQHNLGDHTWFDGITELSTRYIIEDPSAASLTPLIREHIYSRLMNTLEQRKKLHAISAEWLEHSSDMQLQSAYHYAQAGNAAATLALLEQHTDIICMHGQASLAVDIIDTILQSHPNQPTTTPELLCLRGDFLLSTTRSSEAEQNYRQALRLVNNPQRRAHVIWRMSSPLLQQGLAQETLQLIQSALDTLPASEDYLQGYLHAMQSKALLMVSELNEALASAETALNIAQTMIGDQRHNGDNIRIHAGSTRAIILHIQQQIDESISQWRTVAIAAKRNGKQRSYLRILLNLANIYVEQGMFSLAMQTYQETRSGFEQLGDNYGLGRVYHGLGLLYGYQGELEKAQAALDTAIELKEAINDYQGIATSTAQKAIAYMICGDIQQAQHVTQTALIDGRLTGEKRFHCIYQDNLGLVAILQQDWQQAASIYASISNSPLVTNDPRLHDFTLTHLGVLALAQGQLDQASHYLNQPLTVKHTEGYLERILAQMALARYQNASETYHELRNHFEANVGEYSILQYSMDILDGIDPSELPMSEIAWVLYSPIGFQSKQKRTPSNEGVRFSSDISL